MTRRLAAIATAAVTALGTHPALAGPAASTGPTLTTLASFTNGVGEGPQGTLALDAAGDLFGAADIGGIGYGSVFELPAGTGTIAPVLKFAGNNGAYPYTPA